MKYSKFLALKSIAEISNKFPSIQKIMKKTEEKKKKKEKIVSPVRKAFSDILQMIQKYAKKLIGIMCTILLLENNS